jgi:hypothetical protein
MRKENFDPLRLSSTEERMWRSRYELFARLYKGRDDVIAEHRDGEYAPVEGSGLTLERFLDHVRLKKTYAVYNKDNAGMVNFGLFDVDVFPRDKGWAPILAAMGEKKKETALIIQTLADMGLERRNLLIEFPTVGFHLFLFFDNPVPAKALKSLMGFVLKRSGLEKIPFYPRKVEGSPWGDRVQLPLRINRNTSRRSNFIHDLESFDPEHYDNEPDFSVLEEVVPIDSAWVLNMMDKYALQ